VNPDDAPVSDPITEDPRPAGLRPARSLVVVNTGDGKGKSTAAFGIVMRAVARGWRVAVIQFLKSGKWHVGEEDTARRLGVDWWALGEGFSWDSSDLSEDEAVAQQAWAHAAAVIRAGEHRLVVLDELGVCASAGSACASGAIEPSHVLLAMGHSAEDAKRHVRLSLGHATTGADIDAALVAFPKAVERLRG